MTSSAFITLTNSNSSLSKNFRVIQGGYAPELRKTGTQRLTVTGKLDNQIGPILRRWRYVVRVYHTDPVGGDWGTLADLKAFFSHNDPGGTPSNVITLTDFDTEDYDVYLVGRLTEQPKSPYIDGTHAWFQVPIEMVETEPS
jgi:hypothetical protein